jgi:hypothetical protein
MKIVLRQDQPFPGRIIVIPQRLIVFHDLHIVNPLLSKKCRSGFGTRLILSLLATG